MVNVTSDAQDSDAVTDTTTAPRTDDDHEPDDEDHAHGAPVVKLEVIQEAHVVPVIPLMEPPSDVDACATNDFGPGLLRRWRAAVTDYCTGGRSRIRCYRITQARHAGPDNFCEIENAVFRPQQNELVADCKPTPEASNGRGGLRADLFPPDMLKWLAILRLEPLPSDAVATAPDETMVMAWRDCNSPFNPFHCYGDPINLFLELQMFGLDPNHVRVLFMDDAPAGVWFDMWRTMAATVMPRAEWTATLPATPVLVPRLINNISPGSNFIWKDFWHPTPCPLPVPLLIGFQQHMRRGLGLDAHGEHAPHRIVVSLRTPTDRLRGNPNALKRLVANEAALLHALRRAFPDREVVGVDTGALAFREQVELLHSASMLLGVHGAGMTLMVYMQPKQTAVVELFPYHPPNDGKPRCYENMAAWLGLSYHTWDNQDPGREGPQGLTVDIDAVVAAALHARKASEAQKTWVHNPKYHEQFE
jgi:hypothetical protein